MQLGAIPYMPTQSVLPLQQPTAYVPAGSAASALGIGGLTPTQMPLQSLGLQQNLASDPMALLMALLGGGNGQGGASDNPLALLQTIMSFIFQALTGQNLPGMAAPGQPNPLQNLLAASLGASPFNSPSQQFVQQNPVSNAPAPATTAPVVVANQGNPFISGSQNLQVMPLQNSGITNPQQLASGGAVTGGIVDNAQISNNYRGAHAQNLTNQNFGITSPTQLGLPIAANSGVRVSQGFHASHPALDLAVAQGTPIHAAGNGLIAKIGWDPNGYGNYMVIDHGNGITSLYGHMVNRPNGQVGQQVTQGTVIGNVGSTGNSTGPHLHYEVEQNGRQVFLNGGGYGKGAGGAGGAGDGSNCPLCNPKNRAENHLSIPDYTPGNSAEGLNGVGGSGNSDTMKYADYGVGGVANEEVENEASDEVVNDAEVTVDEEGNVIVQKEDGDNANGEVVNEDGEVIATPSKKVCNQGNSSDDEGDSVEEASSGGGGGGSPEKTKSSEKPSAPKGPEGPPEPKSPDTPPKEEKSDPPKKEEKSDPPKPEKPPEPPKSDKK